MRLSNNLLRAHVSGFEKAIVALRAAGGQSRLHEEIAALFAQNAQVAGDDALAAAVRTAMQQIAASVPDLPAQQASKYQNWLLTRYRQNWVAQTQTNPPQALLLEDLSKYADDLALYHSTSNVIKKRAGISTDLFAIDSPFELYQQLKALRGEVATEFKPLSPTQQEFIDSNQAIVVGQTAQWRLVMPLTIAASQEFGSGTRWCTAARDINYFEDYFPEKTLLYLEASGIGKHAFVLENGKITSLFDAEDTRQEPEQQQALLKKLPTLAAFFTNLDAALPLLQPAIDKADLSKVFDLITAGRNFAPHAPMSETALIKKLASAKLTADEKDDYLLKAATRGLTKTAAAMIKLGADVRAYNDGALRRAAAYGHTAIVKLLLKHGADVHADNDSALRTSAQNGNIEAVKLLLKHGAVVPLGNSYTLGRVARNGDTEIARLLLKHGADARADNGAALRWAVDYCRVAMVKLLLEHGADVHTDNDYALHQAFRFGRSDMLLVLQTHIAKQQPRRPPRKGFAGTTKKLSSNP